MHRGQRSFHPVNPIGKGEQRRAGSHLVGLSNAYGFIPHKLISTLLARHHALEKIKARYWNIAKASV